MGHRRKARENAMQMLYQVDMTEQQPHVVARLHWQSHPAPDAVREYAERLLVGACEHLEEIDGRIESGLHNWRMERMARVDCAVLRLAVYEFLYEPEIPKSVAIDEAIEIAKRFSSKDSSQFVNGVLDGIKRELDAVA